MYANIYAILCVHNILLLHCVHNLLRLLSREMIKHDTIHTSRVFNRLALSGHLEPFNGVTEDLQRFTLRGGWIGFMAIFPSSSQWQ